MTNHQKLTELLAIDPNAIKQFRSDWIELLDQSIWADMTISKIGAISRLRKRLLDIGENLRSLTNSRAWIPQIREQLKNALGTSIKLRDSIAAADMLVKQIDGGKDHEIFTAKWRDFKNSIEATLSINENRWASALDDLAMDRAEE